MQSIKKITKFGFVGFFAIVILLSGANIAAAEDMPSPPADTRITSFTVTPVSTTLGATTTYNVSLTLNETIDEIPLWIGGNGVPLGISFNTSGGCPPEVDWRACNVDLSNAGISGLAGSVTGDTNQDNIYFIASDALAAGTINFSVTGVKNPTYGGGLFNGRIQIQSPQVGEDEMWPEGTSSNFILGAVSFYGKVLTPSGNPINGVGVNVRNEDFSFNYGTGASPDGSFALPSTGMVAGGKYFIEIWLPNGTVGYIAPSAIQKTYSGTVQNVGTITLAVASKTITGTVRYDTGGAVTTANIRVWNNNGSSAQADVNSSGQYTLTIGGGDWEMMVDKQYNEDGPVETDWVYNENKKQISFADNNSSESQTMNFTVQKTNSKIKGCVKTPDGNFLQGGWVDIRTGDGQGNGASISGQNGCFTANVSDGTYKLQIFPDNQNPDMARFYLPERTVEIADGQTINLGNLVMKEKTSQIKGKVMLEDGTGVGDIRIGCWQNNASGWGESVSGADGTYSIWLQPGQWQCQAQTGSDSDYIPINAGGKTSMYELKDHTTVSGVNHTVKLADATLVVKTVGEDGKAITGNAYGWAYARVKGAGFEKGSEFGSNLDRGTATIKLIGGSTFIVGAYMPADQGGYLLEKEVEIAVPKNSSKETALTLVLPDAEIYGFLKDQDGKVVKGVDAEIFANIAENMGPGSNPGAFARVNPEDGSYSMKVRGGNKYVLGYWFNMSDEFVQTHPDFTPFTVPVGGKVPKIITAFRADTYVDATLLDPDGKSIDFGFVWCSNQVALKDKVKGDFEGGKVIEAGGDVIGGKAHIPLVSGEYECGAGMKSGDSTYMPPENEVVTVTSSYPKKITLQFREADATLSGSVKLEDGSDIPYGWCHAWQNEGGFSGAEAFDGKASIPLTIGTWYVGCDSKISGDDKFYRSAETRVVVSEKGEISQNFVLAEAAFNLPEGLTEVFDSTVQKVISLPDGTSLSIPANALATEGNVTVIASPNVNVFQTSDTKIPFYAWDFEALDSSSQLITEFSSNVTISIPYDQAVLEEMGISEENLVAKYYDDTAGVWKLPTGVTVDTDGNIIVVQVNHFTNYAITTNETGAGNLSGSNGPFNLVATPMSDGGPQVGVFDKDGNMIATWFAYSSNLRMGMTVEVADLDGDGNPEIITIPGKGFDAQIRVFDKNGNVLSQFMAYPTGFRNGVSVTVYDLDGDGETEIITVPKDATADVKVFDRNGNLLSRFNAFGSGFTMGAEVKATDLDGDGSGEIVAYPTTGSGQIRVFDKDGNVLSQFNTYGAGYRNGVRVTLSDLNGDGTVEIITSPKNATAHVKVFNKDGGLLTQFMGYASTFMGGVKTYAGDVDGNGINEIVVLPDTNGSAHARVFDKDGNLLSQFFAYPSAIKGSFSAAVGDLDGDGVAEISFGPGSGLGPQVRVFDKDGNALSQFFSLYSGYRGGINLSLISQ
ncbi:MAG: FG-GAP-like repeat-containing protein [Patescibacteria group bacterium]